METLTTANAVIFFLLASLHVYWAIGGSNGMDVTVPTDSNGRKLFRPGRGITLLVALGLLAFGLCNTAFAGWLQPGLAPSSFRYAILLIAVIFLLRAIGDFRYIGMAKRYRQSRFARWDTLLYTPLCLFLAASHSWLYFL